ncbi:MAG: PAS domain S-box protein [Deltaproteobacteria bacterium]|nr:PAS domain S-box protein [Deltaproteobacteria bacterium]
MLVKKYLGKTLREMGFVTKQQLEEALERQKQITREKAPEEGLQRARLVTESRIPKETEVIPLLGQILTDMGLVSKEQLQQALKEQEKSFEDFMALENEKLLVAIEIGSLVNSTLNLSEVLHLIMKHANRVTNSVASTLMLLDEETGELVFSVPTGPKENELIDIRIPPGQGIAGWVVKHEKPLLIPDVKADSRFYGEVDEISGFETKSILCIPLMAKTKMIGVLEVINTPDRTCFTEKDELLLSLFGYQATVAIENARLCGELQEQLDKSQRAERALRGSEAKYSTVVENSKDGIIMIRDRLLTFVNKASIELVGFPPEEMIGADFLDFVAPDYRDLVLERYTDRMAGKDLPSIYEIELLGKDGETAPVELNAMRIDFENQPTDLVFIRDITERKRLEAQLHQAERMESLGTLANLFDENGYGIRPSPF